MRTFLPHKFVEYIPSEPEEGILYISIQYKSAVHLCVCGCKNKVVTPITPVNWQLTFDGVSVTLYPSIGNWNFDCQSHYFITNNKIEIMSKWSPSRITSKRKFDQKRTTDYYKERKDNGDGDTEEKKNNQG